MTISFKFSFAALEHVLMAGLVLLSFSSGLARADSKAIADDVTLYAGQAMVRNAPGPLARIAVGDGKVLAVKIVDKQELVMIGEKPGDTSMQLWMIDGSQRSIAVHVTGATSSR